MAFSSTQAYNSCHPGSPRRHWRDTYTMRALQVGSKHRFGLPYSVKSIGSPCLVYELYTASSSPNPSLGTSPYLISTDHERLHENALHCHWQGTVRPGDRASLASPLKHDRCELLHVLDDVADFREVGHAHSARRSALYEGLRLNTPFALLLQFVPARRQIQQRPARHV